MSVIFICGSGLNDALISNLCYALSAEQKGKEVKVLVTGEALNRLCNGITRWSDSLAGIEATKTISKGAKDMGLPLGSSYDPREMDVKSLARHVSNAGVTLLACPVWSKMLGLGGKLPGWLKEIKMEEMVQELMSAEKVIGSF